MKNNSSIILLLFFITICYSCKAILALQTKKSVSNEIKVLKNSEKTVVFIPMKHIGKVSYFESIKKEIDSLRKEGFIIFIEGIYYKTTNEANKDTMNRKMRRILKYHLTSSYKDSNNNSYPRYIRKNNFVMQTMENTGVKKGDFLADLSIDSIISAYEKNYGTILLNDCDYKTDLLEKYKCKSIQKHAPNALLKSYREENLVNKIITNDSSKIAVMYGEGHWYGVSRKLAAKGFNIFKIKDYLSTNTKAN